MTRRTVTATLLASAIALTACGGGGAAGERATTTSAAASSTSASPTPQTLSVAGTLTLVGPNSASQGGTEGETCFGTGGFDDLKVGTQVTVTDASGTTIALGSIDKSAVGGQPGTPARTCEFDFLVDDVPRGESFYKVKVAQRDGPQYTEDDLGRALSLTLGNA